MSLQDLANTLGVNIINYKESVVITDDPANKEIQGKVVEESFQLPMVQIKKQASLIIDRLQSTKGYPLLQVELKCGRTAYRLQRGDLFKFTSSLYGITEMVCRVLDITEENLETENILINAIQDIYYLSNNIDVDNINLLGSNGNTTKTVFQWLEALTNVKIIETPFALVGEAIGILPIASRETGSETGYQVYLSIDGTSYSLIDNVVSYAPSGTLVANYPATTNKVDDEVGFSIDSTDVDIDLIDSITRAYLWTENNTALLGDELIAIQTITPDSVVDDRYNITGIVRAKWDTEPADHSSGTKFYFLGKSNSKHITNSKIIAGASLYFKLVPYSRLLGNISDATAISVTITGRAKKPYPPDNFKANSSNYKPTYTSDIVLTWDSRRRTQGAGIGIISQVVDATPTWEGYFEIEVYVSSVLKRTTSTIDALTWTYTSAMNTTDNGSLANEVVFKVKNYKIENNFTYASIQRTITVTKE